MLDGENPESRFVEDAHHWANVYAELLAFKERLLAAAHAGLKHLPEPAVHREVAETDARVLRAERDRLQKRLRFWRRRQRELTQLDAAQVKPAQLAKHERERLTR